MTSTTPHPLAVVTGASAGIGRELAREFADHDFDVLVVAEDTRIEAVARELKTPENQTFAVQADLATDEGVDALYQRIRELQRPVDVAALNAGVGVGGGFVDTDLEGDLRTVDLNVRSTVHLAKHLTRDMVERGAGRVLFTSSIASTMPGPFQATYNASKSFVQSFALALRNELKDTGVTVTSLMPGPTDTEFFERAGMEDTKIGAGEKDDPADVARQGFEAVMAGDERVVAASLKTRTQAVGSRLLPDSVKAEVHRRQSEPGSAS